MLNLIYIIYGRERPTTAMYSTPVRKIQKTKL